MNLKDLFDIVERAMIHCDRRHQDPTEINVCIPIQTLPAIGGTPCVDIKSVHNGFDWDMGKLMLYPEKELSLTDRISLDQLREEHKKLGWTAYEVGNLKREIIKLKKQIEDNV